MLPSEVFQLQFGRLSVGIDLQIETEKLQKVAPKFCSPDDYEILTTHYSIQKANHICWSVKEAVFKAYGAGRVNYKDDITFIAFANDNPRRPLIRLGTKDGRLLQYEGKLSFIGPYLMAQVVDQADPED